MVNCYEHVFESSQSVRKLVEGSRNTLFQLNKCQCQILTKELVETCNFLDQWRDSLKFRGGVGCISLQHLCIAVKRAELLVKKCCCKDLESWLVAAIMLVEILEEFMVVMLDLHLWRMFVDFAIICGKGLTQEKKVEDVKVMDEKYHQLFKDLHRENHALQQAAAKDKETIILSTSTIAETHGWTSGLQYLRAIYLKSWLTRGEANKDVELTKSEYMDTLGSGGGGIVNKVKWLGVECALKILRGKDEKEATALKGLFHPNIIRLLHYWEDRPQNPRSCLLMELMPTNLHDYMKELLERASSLKMQKGKDGVPFPLLVAIDIMYQIAQAMRYMHGKRLTHRDLKPANILVKERPKVDLVCYYGAGYLDIKLADFGLVKAYKNSSTFGPHSQNKGTGMYRAPEMFGSDFAQARHYLPMVDVWSFGITCVEILSGKNAYGEYAHLYGSAIQNMIKDEGLRPTLPKHCPEYLAFCITSCWQLLPTRRPTFANLCKLLRHAKLMSLGVTNLNDSKVFFAYLTRSNEVNNMPLLPSSSKLRISALFQSLKLVGIGSRSDPNVAEVLPEVRLDPTPLIIESPVPDDGIAGETMIREQLPNYPTVVPAADIVHEERVGATPIVTDIAEDVATPVQQIQASLSNGISPGDASSPIQSADTPPPKLAVGAILRNTEQDAEVKAVGNLQKQCSGEKNKEPLRLLQDWLEDNSSEAERPRVRKTASASNSPSALSYTPPWTDSSTLPPRNLEDHKRSPESSSSSIADRNNGSRQPEGYHFRAPPAGSDQDDDTGSSPKNLLMAVMGVKSTVNHFAEMLIANMNKHPVEYEHLKQTILQEVGVHVDRANHWKFSVQAFICNRVFDGFDAPNGYFGVEYFESDRTTKRISFADFTKYKDKAATISTLLNGTEPAGSFLGRFCFKKFKSITGEVGSNKPSPVFQEEWSGIGNGYHPNTVFYESFLKVAVSVWLVHRLVHSFEETVDMLIYEKGTTFQRQTMESVVPGSYEEEDEESDGNTEVGFSVIPGFRASRSVVKCEVYLRSKSRNTDIEITGRPSTEMTLAKASSSKTTEKTSSAKLPLKPHTLGMLVLDSNSPGSSQYPEVYGSFSHFIPPRVADAGMSEAEAYSDMFGRTHPHSLSLDNQGKSGHDQGSSGVPYPGFRDPNSSSHSLAAPKSRPSTQRPPGYVVRPTRASESRRLANLRHSSTG